jgi:hypothetical protein
VKTAILTLTFGLLAAPVLAQGTEEDARANANVLPMIQEQVEGYHAQVVTACIVATAQPEEKAQLAASAGPSVEIAPVVNAVLGRPETIDCIEATLAQQ